MISGEQPEAIRSTGNSSIPSFSRDGTQITFASILSDLVVSDNNASNNIFVVPNSYEANSRVLNVRAGQTDIQFNVELVPGPGEISGRLFQDLSGNGIFDTSESGFPGLKVYLDMN